MFFDCSLRVKASGSDQPLAVQTAAAPVSDAAATLTMQPVSANNKMAAQKRVSSKAAQAGKSQHAEPATAAAAADPNPAEKAGTQQANRSEHVVEEQPASKQPLQNGGFAAADASVPSAGEDLLSQKDHSSKIMSDAPA